MSIKIHLDTVLSYSINSQEVVVVRGNTVGECLNHLVKQFPAIEKMLFAKNGKLLGYVSIYVNGEDAYPDELAKPVKDGDELHILYILGGG